MQKLPQMPWDDPKLPDPERVGTEGCHFDMVVDPKKQSIHIYDRYGPQSVINAMCQPMCEYLLDLAAKEIQFMDDMNPKNWRFLLYIPDLNTFDSRTIYCQFDLNVKDGELPFIDDLPEEVWYQPYRDRTEQVSKEAGQKLWDDFNS